MNQVPWIVEEYHVTIDQYGTVQMPDACRMLLSHGGFLTRSFNGRSLTVYPTEIGEDVSRRLADPEPMPDPLTAWAVRFLSCGIRITLDASGRVTIPHSLVRVAHLQHEVIVRFVGERLEIWDAQTRQQHRDDDLPVKMLGTVNDCSFALYGHAVSK